MRSRVVGGWQSVLLMAAALAAALACASQSNSKSVQPEAGCWLGDRDRQVLQVVLEQVVLGSGACGEPGLALVYEATVLPEFPETVEESRRRREIDERLAAGEEIEEQELFFASPISEATDLELHNGWTLDRATVQSTLERRSCRVGDLRDPTGWTLTGIEARQHDEFFLPGVVEGWKRLRSRYPEMECLVKFSAPGYNEPANLAVVSFSRMNGSLSGMGGFVVLRRENGRWRIEWHEGLWVA